MQEELLKKLRYKSGRALVANAPQGFSLGIEEEAGSEDRQLDFVLLFVNSAQEAPELVAPMIPRLNDDALFWVAFPKQSGKTKSDINRDSLAALVQESTPYRPVSNVAIDEKWSALRFRPKDQVKSSKS